MKNVIQMISNTEFKLTRGGHEMTLKKEGAEWAMYTVNAMVKAYNRGFAMPKYFRSLDEVENKYKSWRGIATLVNG
jgi:hypothetical protein